MRDYKPTTIKFQTEHNSYLLRMWRDSPRAGWRFLLRDLGNKEQRGFGSLEMLVEFLRRVVEDDKSNTLTPGPSPLQGEGESDSLSPQGSTHTGRLRAELG